MSDWALKNPVMVRTLSYFARDSRADPQAPLLHYLVNTDEPLRRTEPWAATSRAEALQRASSYAQSVGYKGIEENKGQFFLVSPGGSRAALQLPKGSTPGHDGLTRALGRAVNEARFGTRAIVPPVQNFEHHPRGFSVRNGLMATHLSLLAYAPVDVIKQQLTKWGFNADTFTPLGVKNGVAAGFVVRDRNNSVVSVFRGTANAGDVGTDLDAVPSSAKWLPSTSQVRVHDGFDDALSPLWSQWKTAVAKASQGAGTPVNMVFAGHSLGGAEAQLAAVRSKLEPATANAEVQVYTLGSPRVGNDAFRQLYDEKVTRSFRMVSNTDLSDDPVTKVPPEFLGYRHAGTQVTLNEGLLNVHPSRNYKPPEPTAEEIAAAREAISHLKLPTLSDMLKMPSGPMDRAPAKQPGIALHLGGTYLERIGPQLFPLAGWPKD